MTDRKFTEPQPFLAGLHNHGAISLVDFARLCLPPHAPEKYRLLWLMASTGWQPTPLDAVNQGFVNLRDTIRHLKDEGVQIISRTDNRHTLYSGSTTTERYRLIPDPQCLQLSYGLLIGAGFVSKVCPPKLEHGLLALTATSDPLEDE